MFDYVQLKSERDLEPIMEEVIALQECVKESLRLVRHVWMTTT